MKPKISTFPGYLAAALSMLSIHRLISFSSLYADIRKVTEKGFSVILFSGALYNCTGLLISTICLICNS